MTDAIEARPGRVGPILFSRGSSAGRLRLCAVHIQQPDVPVADLRVDGEPVTPAWQRDFGGARISGHRFELPLRDGGRYRVDGESFEVAGIPSSDTGWSAAPGAGDSTTEPPDTSPLRIAYLSCNGLEHGDLEREPAVRNVLWRRLRDQQERDPFHLLLQGGDQLYADEMLEAHPLTRAWRQGRLELDIDPEEARPALERFLLERYRILYSQPAAAHLLARVPSACMWDDHDICDGWGSLPEAQLDAPIGRLVFEVAREAFALLQLGTPSETPPECGLDPEGRTLGWSLALPGLQIIAPDLRSERRPDRVMGPAGWRTLDSALEAAGDTRILLLSSVPAMGPRLSWVERVLDWIPRAQKYEDDLRDQWQSRAHRAEWRRFLQRLIQRHETGAGVTVLSGEIHLAAWASLPTARGPLRQLIASGITHPAPPRAYALALSLLARLGEAPLARHPIKLHPLPGRRAIYTAERNYLILSRSRGRWSAQWELEDGGPTPVLDLDD